MRGHDGICFAATLSLALFSPGDEALAQYGGYGGGHMGPWMMDGWGMGWIGGILMMVFWVAVIAGIIFLIRWLVVASRSGGQSASPGGDSALDILRKRYALGEINKQEFEEMKRDLMA